MNDSPPIRETISEATDEPSGLPVLPPREAQSPPEASWLNAAVIDALHPDPSVEAAAGAETPEPEPEHISPMVSAQEPGSTIETAEIAVEAPSAETVVEAPSAETVVEAPSAETLPIESEPAAPIFDQEAASAPSTKPVPEGSTTSEAKPAVPGIGVLLVNLGTPDAADPVAVRRYLKEFLSDPRVIEKDSALWRMVLNGIILPLRSRRKARDYQKIWNHEKNESPLKTITRLQAGKLAAILEPLGRHVVVDWAMRYADQPIAARIEALIGRGCDRILVMPLYPQYSAATTATVCDEVFRYMMLLRRQPALRILPAYYEDPYYIEVLASSLKAELKALTFEPDVIIASYHGMPKEYVLKGDPYESQCVRTTQLLREQLGLDETKLMMTFQSRFGLGQWLQPYTIKTVKALAKKGVKNLVVLTPGFSADCLETLEEIAVENARVFKRYGGQNFVAIPCLNDSEAGMLMIWQLAMRELKGWV